MATTLLVGSSTYAMGMSSRHATEARGAVIDHSIVQCGGYTPPRAREEGASLQCLFVAWDPSSATRPWKHLSCWPSRPHSRSRARALQDPLLTCSPFPMLKALSSATEVNFAFTYPVAMGKLSGAGWLCTTLTCLCWFNIALGYPLCTNMQAPARVPGGLDFCSAPEYRQNGCCSKTDDQAIQQTFNAMNITDTRCADIVKQLLCVKCDAFAATLLGPVLAEPQRPIPYLCNSTSTTNSTNSTGQGYCHDVWDACFNATIKNSPFVPVLNPGGAPPPSSSLIGVSMYGNGSLGSVFSSEAEFCSSAGPLPSAADYCFSGDPFVPPPPPANFTLPQTICIEKVTNETYLNVIPFPDVSNRVAVTNQAGLIWLATIPGPGNGPLVASNQPFLDLTSRVTNKDELGFLGFAFHPDFANNGRFFVSYNCDKQQWPDCGGTCGCNDDTNCNPSHLRDGEPGGDSTTDPCRYSAIVAEYTVNSSTGPPISPLKAEIANPKEVRRIFLMSLPYSAHHGGQILFGPLDKKLYLMMGDGGSTGDPFNFAQNKKSLLGKILRLDVDNLPSETDISDQNLWGQYGIPTTNPFYGSNDSRPEIWALGLRNPWRCSFDAENPIYFYCGDVGQDTEEEVNLISRQGNYGWRVYEANTTFLPPLSPGGNTSAKSIDAIFPILEYHHPPGDPNHFYAAITGGMVSYSREDACIYGKFVYADLFTTMYVGAEVPRLSGNYRAGTLDYRCSSNSPFNCTFSNASSSTPILEQILSFGLDNSNNFYILAGDGAYRVVNPDNCNLACTDVLPPLPPLPPSQAPTSSSFPPLLSPALSPGHSSANHLRSFSVLRVVVLLLGHLLPLVVLSNWS